MTSNCPTTPWTNFFHTISNYDFADEVNLDVLGHLFERSITELEKLKESGLFGDAEKASRYAAMPQSAKRKQLGIYYTPPELTSRIVQYTVEELIAERFAAAAVEFGVSEKDARRGMAPDDAEYWRRCLAILRNLKIVDPACGSGAFLFQAYDVLEARYNEVIGHLDQLGEAGRRRSSPSRFRRSFCRRTCTASISRPRRSRSRNWPSGFARPVRANCWPSSRRTSSTATRWSTTRRSTRPVSIGASGFPDVSPSGRGPGEGEASRASIA